MAEQFEKSTGERHRLPLLLILLLVVVVAIVAKLAGPTPGVELTLAATASPTVATTAPASSVPVAASDTSAPDVARELMQGRWTTLPAAPIAGRTRHTATWTGSEMLIFGGQPDPGLAHGARFDPARQQ